MSWQSMETAPKDGTKVDLLAKRWRATDDTFWFERFPDCFWMVHDSLTSRKPYWANLNNDYHPVGWMPIPTLTP